jgi:hypothetical protein
LSHTWCEPCLLGLAIEARAVRTACGGIVEGAPESGSPSVPHSQRARKSQGLRGNTTVYRVGITFPLAFCPTDRSTIRDESPIDWTTVGASEPFPATVRSGRLGWLPTLERGRPRKPLILSMDDCQSFQQKKSTRRRDQQLEQQSTGQEKRRQSVNINTQSNTTIEHTIHHLALTVVNIKVLPVIFRKSSASLTSSRIE